MRSPIDSRAAAIFCAMLLASCGSAPSPTPQPETKSTVAGVPTSSPATVTISPTAVAPTPTAAVIATPTAAQPAAADTTPKVRTVWNTSIGSNKMDGTCSGAPILPAYGQVQITPSADVLEWKNQQTTYTFKRSGAGQWRFAGASPLNDGTVDLQLTFKDDKNLTVVHKLVPTKDPGCTHTFTYNGTFMWERP